MTKAALFSDDDALDIPSLYDPLEEEEEAAQAGDFDWSFLPKPAAARGANLASILGQEALALMDFSFDYGRLAALVAEMGPVAIERLADEEAVALSWWLGDRVSASALALWRGFRLGAAAGDSQGHARAAWAARHLAASQPEPLWTDEILPDLARKYPEFHALPALFRAALLFHEALGPEDEASPGRRIEAAVAAARLAAAGRNLPFVPLALTSLSALRASGPLEKRLALWNSAAHQSVLSALLKLQRLRQWKLRASRATADLSGRTPPALIDCLMEYPIVSAVTVSEACKVSRASAERNLALFEARGLTQEITGQARFRIWSAKV